MCASCPAEDEKEFQNVGKYKPPGRYLPNGARLCVTCHLGSKSHSPAWGSHALQLSLSLSLSLSFSLSLSLSLSSQPMCIFVCCT